MRCSSHPSPSYQGRIKEGQLESWDFLHQALMRSPWLLWHQWSHCGDFYPGLAVIARMSGPSVSPLGWCQRRPAVTGDLNKIQSLMSSYPKCSDFSWKSMIIACWAARFLTASFLIIGCWAAWFLPALLLDYCLLSCVIPACSAPGLLPAELRESCLLSSLITVCWAAWFLPAQLQEYCLLGCKIRVCSVTGVKPAESRV